MSISELIRTEDGRQELAGLLNVDITAIDNIARRILRESAAMRVPASVEA
jgi:hypothetical protein